MSRNVLPWLVMLAVTACSQGARDRGPEVDARDDTARPDELADPADPGDIDRDGPDVTPDPAAEDEGDAVDTGIDADPPDVPQDPAFDARPDVAADVPSDPGLDVVPDLLPDILPDLAPDLPADLAPDLPADLVLDLPVDLAPDLPVDLLLDAPTDLGPDLGPEDRFEDPANDAGPGDTPDEPPETAPDTADGDVPDPEPYGPAGTPLPIVGFGAGTLGGHQPGGDTYLVTSLADDGPGSLREGLRTDGHPRLVLFEVDGVIEAASPFLVPSNITVDARGRDVTLRGKGLVIPGSDQVILVNFALEDIAPEDQDGIQIGSALPDPSEHVVLDHLRLTQHGDGGDCKNVDEAVSIVFGSRDITIAWCRFENWEKVLLAGNGDADPSLDALISLTWHHTLARATGRRHPQARYGRYHLFNNFLDDWRMYGWAFESPWYESFGSQVQDNGRMLIQGQMVRRLPHDKDAFSQANDASRCESGGDLLESGTWVDPTSTAPLKFGAGCAQREAFDLPYEAEVETAGETLRDRVDAGAGNTLSSPTYRAP